MPGHVLHLYNLDCHCLSEPLPSSFSVHISHSITCFPAPCFTSPRFPYAFLTALCPYGHVGTFAALTPGLSAFQLSICPSGGTVGIALFCTFQITHKHSNLTFFCFHGMSHVLIKKTHEEHVQTTESGQYPSCIRVTSAHFE
jgi:hypothetical protein